MCPCARVCACVRVLARVLRHPAAAATAYGRVCPAPRLVRASRAGGCTAPSARGPRRRPRDRSAASPRRAGPRLRAAGTRPPTTARKKVQLWGLPQSYACRGGRRRQKINKKCIDKGAERLGPGWDGSLPAPPLPACLERRGKSPGRDARARASPPGAEGKGRSPPRGSCRRLGAPVRVRARRGSQRGWGRPGRGPRAMPSGGAAGGAGRGRRCASGPGPPPPLLLPPASAGGGLSRPSRSSPHATD